MGRRGFFSALNYLETDRRAGRRTVRADGRPLHRPIGNWSDETRTEVQKRRDRRRQPRWPRVLGWSMIGIALFAAYEAEYPIPRPARAAISVTAASCLLAIEPTFPVGPHEGVPQSFSWVTDSPPPFTLVLFDAAYREVARIPGIAQNPVEPDPGLMARLAAGGTFHWYVQGEGPDGTVRSPLEAVEIH